MSSRHNDILVTRLNNILKDFDIDDDIFDLLYAAIDEYVGHTPITDNGTDDDYVLPVAEHSDSETDEHVVHVAEHSESETDEHICETCGMECSSAIELLDHNMIYHENAFGDQFGCDVCSYWTKTSDELNEHYRTTHGETETDSESTSDENDPIADGKDNNEDEHETKSNIGDDSSDSEESNIGTDPIPKFIDEQKSEFKKNLPKLSIAVGSPEIIDADDKSIDPLKSARKTFKLFKERVKRERVPVTERTRAPRNVLHVQDGTFECPICELKFNSPYHLGEHFSYAHQSYEMQKILDTKTSIYFPGYDMLHMINMIDFLDNDQLKKIIHESCPICCSEYTTSIISRTRSCTQFDRLHMHKSPDKTSYQKIEDIIKKTYADTEISLFDHHYPLLMTCCKKYICHSCIKSHIMATYNITCPFCTKDHTREDMTYVTELKPGMFNKSTWQTWWSKHIDILF